MSLALAQKKLYLNPSLLNFLDPSLNITNRIFFGRYQMARNNSEKQQVNLKSNLYFELMIHEGVAQWSHVQDSFSPAQ